MASGHREGKGFAAAAALTAWESLCCLLIISHLRTARLPSRLRLP